MLQSKKIHMILEKKTAKTGKNRFIALFWAPGKNRFFYGKMPTLAPIVTPSTLALS